MRSSLFTIFGRWARGMGTGIREAGQGHRPLYRARLRASLDTEVLLTEIIVGTFVLIRPLPAHGYHP